MLGAAALAGACRKGGGKHSSPTTTNEWTALIGAWSGVEGGDVLEKDGTLELPFSDQITAARWSGAIPQSPFELEYEARRINGTDFFGTVTFPARKDEYVSLVIGGWGGGLIGISSIDDLDASENETGSAWKFETGRWYRIRILCTARKIEAWIDHDKAVDVDTENRKLSLRPGPISSCVPFGFASWQTTAEIRKARWRQLHSEK